MSTRQKSRRGALLRRNGDDDGATAIEFGLLFALMGIIAVFMMPVGSAYLDKMRLGRALGDGLRFATSTPNTPAYGSSSRRPTVGEIKAEVIRAYTAAGGSGLSSSNIDINRGLAPGQTVTIRITKSDHIGPVGSLLHAFHIASSSSITMSVDASGREE